MSSLIRWLPAVALVGCVMTPERFAARFDAEVAEIVEICGGPSAPDPDVEGTWSGDVACESFDPRAARACLSAYRGLRVSDCIDPVEQPGAHPVPAACDLAAICGNADEFDTDA